MTAMNTTIIEQFLTARIRHQKEQETHPPYDYEQKLLEAIRIGNIQYAQEMLHTINELKGARLAATPLRSKKNSLIALCTLFTRAIITGGVHAELAFHLSDVYILEIEKVHDLVQLQQLEGEMLLHFIQTLKKERRTKQYSSHINLALSYIDDHILEELSLPIIAQHAHLHPSYLSNRFKQETGMSLTSYIQAKRIEDSKYFLLHTDTSISDIALLFKFCNQSYYTMLFKQKAGCTPREFRNQKRNKMFT